jgi:hypothetical protein
MTGEEPVADLEGPDPAAKLPGERKGLVGRIDIECDDELIH